MPRRVALHAYSQCQDQVLTLIELQRWSRRDDDADQCIVGWRRCAVNAGSSDGAGNAIAIDPGVRSIRYAWAIRRMRSLLMRVPFEAKNIDINDTMPEVFDFLSIQASARNVALYLRPSPEPLRVKVIRLNYSRLL
jgi:hypothetical protein